MELEPNSGALARYITMFRQRVSISRDEISEAAFVNPMYRGSGGARSWIEEELAKQPDSVIEQLAQEVTKQMIDVANGPLQNNHIWHNFRSGHEIMLAIATAGVIALECERHGLFTRETVSA